MNAQNRRHVRLGFRPGTHGGGATLLGFVWSVFLGLTGCSLAVNLDELSGGVRRHDASVDAMAGSADSEIPGGDGGRPSDQPDATSNRDAADDVASDVAGPANDADVSGDVAVDATARDDADGDGGNQAETAPRDASLPGDAPMNSTSDADSDAGSDAEALVCPVSPKLSTTLHLAGTPTATACGYASAALPRFYVAADAAVFAASAACGRCMLIETPAASVEALVVDLGPAVTLANPTSIAVSRAALNILAPDGSTYVAQGVGWHFVACTLPKPGMTFTIQTGSSANYAAVLIQNYRYGLANVEYRIGTVYRALSRAPYNYWIAAQGMGTGPFILRITDIYGHAVEQPGIPLAPGSPFSGQAQFPACKN